MTASLQHGIGHRVMELRKGEIVGIIDSPMAAARR